MKKMLFIGLMMVFGLQTFSYSPGSTPNISSPKLQAAFNEMTLQNLITLTPKEYRELTGKKMTLKQKISLVILKAKLKKQFPVKERTAKESNIGLLALIMGAGAFPVAFIPAVGVISIGMAIAAIILGIIGLGKKKGDTKSLIGLVLGSAFFFLLLVLVAAFASSGWY
jgi:hypothetical protein